MKHDLAKEWQTFEDNVFAQETVARAFGLQWPFDETSHDIAAWLVLLDLGVTAGRIVREPSYRRSPEKARRDAELGRQTIHLAPLWRHPIVGEEQGYPALILPVSTMDVTAYADCSHTLSRSALSDDDFLAAIADHIAIPLDGSRPLSLTGHTISLAHPRGLGRLSADMHKRLVLYGGGKAWLSAAIESARAISADTPAHLIEQIHAPFPAPEENGALLIEPLAFEWRITRGASCAIPENANEIRCPDSRRLAQLIDTEMRKKEKPRPLPVVRGPAERRAEAQGHQTAEAAA
jgi:hypothetical protein